jgi:two-component system cell cycle response regulator
VARRLLSSLRVTDTGGRYGGEELLVVLPQNGAEGAAILAERWRQAVENEPFETGCGPAVSVTLSAGVAEYQPEIECPEDLIAAADAALYRAKDQGRNRVETS